MARNAGLIPGTGIPLAMVTHLVAFRFRDDVDKRDRESILHELESFPRRFPAMKRFRLGMNVSDRDRFFTHAFVVEFDSQAELLAYLHSEEHERFIEKTWRPAIAERAIVSFEH